MATPFETLKSALSDRYRVEEEVGRGGMATVYTAHDLKHDRRVAIKLLSADLTATISGDRFGREIKIAAGLSHPNILGVYDSGQVANLLYYVMPFVDGESLRDKLTRETQLTIDDAIQITCEVAEALSYAHERGVVHRDIKPENILLQSGHALVADFGVAALADRAGAEKLTATGLSVGTAAYMSPEQASGEPTDARADVYALGCTLYEMLAGQRPYTGANAMSIMARHVMDPIPSIRNVRPAVPEELEAAVHQAMEKLPADRFQTMDDFKRGVLGEVHITTTANSPRYTARYRTVRASSKKHQWVWGVVGAVLVLLAGGAYLARGFVTRPTTAVPDASKVAVLYFDDESGGPLRYVADGLTESLIERLTDVAALDVISQNGVRPLRGRPVVTDSVRAAFHVGTIVRGSVAAVSGGRAKVDIHLVDAGSGADISRKSIEVDTAQLATLQGAVLTQVVDFLRERIGDEVRLRGERAETPSAAAWTLAERAGKLRKDADSLIDVGATDRAMGLLRTSDSLLVAAEGADVKWVRLPAARASLSYLWAQLLPKGSPERLAMIDSGLARADNALRLQPNSSDALEAKGQLLYAKYAQVVTTDPKGGSRLLAAAETTLTKAVEQNKDQAGAWATLSGLYYSKPDLQAANNAALKAYQADAYLASAKTVLTRLFWTSHDLEQFPEALKWCNEGRRRFSADPFFTACRLWMYTTRYENPDVDSAWAYRQQYVNLVAEAKRPYADKLSQILVGGALARAGLLDSARHVLLRARATPQLDPSRELEGDEAVMRVILGDLDEAVRLIADYLTVNPEHRKGFATRTGWWWRDLQGNPRFKALIAGAR